MEEMQLPSELIYSGLVLAVLHLYLTASYLLFSIRHPWLTRTQLMLHLEKAALFKKYEKGIDLKINVGSLIKVYVFSLIVYLYVLYALYKAYAVILNP